MDLSLAVSRWGHRWYHLIYSNRKQICMAYIALLVIILNFLCVYLKILIKSNIFAHFYALDFM